VSSASAVWGLYALVSSGNLISNPLVVSDLTATDDGGDVNRANVEIAYTQADHLRFLGGNGISTPNEMFDTVHFPRWSPDGQSLAIVGSLPISSDEFLITLSKEENSTPTVSMHFDSELVAPSWSPNGESIAYVRTPGNLWVIDLATAERRQITLEVPGIYGVEWLTNGDIAFAAPVDGERGAIFVTDLAGNVRQVTPRIMGLDSFDWR
jgi:hypothetical protein